MTFVYWGIELQHDEVRMKNKKVIAFFVTFTFSKFSDELLGKG